MSKLKKPESMEECFYFTNRKITIDDKEGHAIAWVYKPTCPECGKAKLGKPINEKTGKVKRRAKKYVCLECGYEIDIKEIKPTLDLEIEYTCPFCKHKGETKIKYDKRKTWYGVKAYVFKCENCGERIGITKKMKKPKK